MTALRTTSYNNADAEVDMTFDTALICTARLRLLWFQDSQDRYASKGGEFITGARTRLPAAARAQRVALLGVQCS